MNQLLTEATVSSVLNQSIKTVRKWTEKGKLTKNNSLYNLSDLSHLSDIVKQMLTSNWSEEIKTNGSGKYKSIELFSGCGGLAKGLELAGFDVVMLNDSNREACATLRKNRPQWNVINDSISKIDFTKYKGIDLISGGFPCQSFSTIGNKKGFKDSRGSLFYEYVRAIKECQPKMFLGENVKGLFKHDNGKTLDTMRNMLKSVGYVLIEPKVLNSLFYNVPQKRERLIFVGVRKDLSNNLIFNWPDPFYKIRVLKDALKKGELYSTDVPESVGQTYSENKKKILDLIPEGGNWRNLPIDLQKSYMGKIYDTGGGGNTGVARRLNWDSPCPTLTTSPAQKRTDKCHPEETRPLTIREYARIQTFEDEWVIEPVEAYKQIGNAVPVNLAHSLGCAIIRTLE